MTKEEFQQLLEKYSDQIDHFRQMAHDLHDSVNQTYADTLPYGFHLDMVVEGVRKFGCPSFSVPIITTASRMPD